MSDIKIAGITYNDVPRLDVPKLDNTGNASFYDTSGDTATAADVAQGKTFHGASGPETGTASGGGGLELSQLMFMYAGYDGTHTVYAPQDDIYKAVACIPQLQRLILADARSIVGYAAVSNDKLESISAPACEDIGSHAIYTCGNLLDASFPAATFIGDYAFSGCLSLESVDISSYAGSSTDSYSYGYIFQSCSALSSVTATALQGVARGMFQYCRRLESITLPALKIIMANGFNSCTQFKDLYLPGADVVQLMNTNALTGTKIAGSGTGIVHVPANLEADYKAATNWATYASHIVGDLAEV